MAIGAMGGVNGSGAMAYAAARLRVKDEDRSAMLDADPRVYRPDDDEGGPVPCLICEALALVNSLVCRGCRDRGFVSAVCECGAPITRTDQKVKHGTHLRNRCRKCREEMAPEAEGQVQRTVRQ